MKYATLALACGASVMFCAPAQAAVTIGDYTIEEGSFGAGTGVHSTGTQAGTTVFGEVNQDGSAVTFTSSDTLSITGSGQAIIDGPMTDLNVLFATAWDRVTFSFDGDDDGTFSLLVNATDFGTCSICNISDSGQNKFIVSGGGITSLGFTFDPAVSTARQFRVEGVSVGAIPEPTTWAMMLFGFGAIGAAMRRRKSSPTPRLRLA
jgi:hypothetical protein